MRSEFALFFSPRFVSFFWPWRCRGDGTVTVMPGHRETKRCWELVMKKWAQTLEQKIYRLRSFLNDLGVSVFPKIGVPQNGWFIIENPIKMDDLGIPLFLETPIWFPLDSGIFRPWKNLSTVIALSEANVDALSKNGSTPLLVASREGHTPVCKVWNPLNLESPSSRFFFLETRELQ